MADSPLPAPTNRLTNLTNIVLDGLIKGLGANAIIASATTAEPWLNLPVIHWFFTTVINAAAGGADTVIKENVDVIEIRFQNSANLGAYNAIIGQLQTNPKDAQELAAAKAAIDALVNRNK